LAVRSYPPSSFHNVTVENNTASYSGGGIYLHGDHVQATFTECTVQFNKGTSDTSSGGGVAAVETDWIISTAYIRFLDSVVRYNAAKYYAGGIAVEYDNFEFRGGSVSYNSATNPKAEAGGVYVWGGSNTRAGFYGTVVGWNTANGYAGGIEVQTAGTQLTLDRCTIIRNHAVSFDGGGLWVVSYTGGTN